MVQKISNWLQIIADYLNKSYLSPTYLNKKSTEKIGLDSKSVVDLDSRIF
jgi:hypothetical protein